ncbi:hypothetical protein GCM10010435_15140 [Winogradskya consettensis]
MDMQAQLTRKMVKQMLPISLGIFQPAPADQRGPIGEPPLRTVDIHNLPGEQLPMTSRKPMNRMSLWHNTRR